MKKDPTRHPKNLQPVSDLEHAIAGLAQFDRCPPNICLMRHFSAASICSYKLVSPLRFLIFWKTLCDLEFHTNENIKVSSFKFSYMFPFCKQCKKIIKLET